LDLQVSLFFFKSVFQSDIKEDTHATIENLMKSSHQVMMITGDNILTGAHVAKELNMILKPLLNLTKNEKNGVDWLNEKDEIISSNEIDNYDLGVSGDALVVALQNDSNWLKNFVHRIKIFARVSPDQKELILTTLKANNFSTLMCGDGTNDVGALKQAGKSPISYSNPRCWCSIVGRHFR
jgi:manganese-transporting P-type ATPase